MKIITKLTHARHNTSLSLMKTCVVAEEEAANASGESEAKNKRIFGCE